MNVQRPTCSAGHSVPCFATRRPGIRRQAWLCMRHGAWSPQQGCKQPAQRAHGQHCLTRRLQQAICACSDSASTSAAVPKWDVVGLGQAMVDFSATVPDEFLLQLGVAKGSRKIIDAQARAAVLQALDGGAYQITPGGSLCNSLVALSRLGSADDALRSSGGLRVAMAGPVGTDPLGKFFCAQSQNAGVRILSEPVPGSNTGTVMVLTTPDANRTFLSYLGEAQQHLNISAAVRAAITSARVLLIEGYLWEMPGAEAALTEAAQLARSAGAAVALTAGDVGLVKRHRDALWRAVQGADLLFCNTSEAAALLQQPKCTAEAAALALGSHCSMAVVTDGAHGSYLSAVGQLLLVPPYWAAVPPRDTCGAGDAYAAGLLYGFLCGYDLGSMGRAGARVASTVISRQGAALSEQQAHDLAVALPNLLHIAEQRALGVAQ